MKLKNSVSIVIPNFNGEKLLKANLPSIIRALKYKGNNIYEVIVVDDFSGDGSVELIKGMFPDVKLIKHKVNCLATTFDGEKSNGENQNK